MYPFKLVLCHCPKLSELWKHPAAEDLFKIQPAESADRLLGFIEQGCSRSMMATGGDVDLSFYLYTRSLATSLYKIPAGSVMSTQDYSGFKNPG